MSFRSTLISLFFLCVFNNVACEKERKKNNKINYNFFRASVSVFFFFFFFCLMAYKLSWIPKLSLEKKQSWNQWTHCLKNSRDHIFPKNICPKVFLLARIEFELSYDDIAAYHVSHYSTGILHLFHFRKGMASAVIITVIENGLGNPLLVKTTFQVLITAVGKTSIHFLSLIWQNGLSSFVDGQTSLAGWSISLLIPIFYFFLRRHLSAASNGRNFIR